MGNLIILIGYRGVGKTTLGKRLADSMGFDFIDTDNEICRDEDLTVANIIKEVGWKGFRQKERVLLTTLSSLKNTVVSTGGGAILHQQEWQELKKFSIIFWLTADKGIIIDRLARDSASEAQRPALTDSDNEDEVEKILKIREPLYRKTAHYQIDTAKQNIDEAVLEMREFLKEKIL